MRDGRYVDLICPNSMDKEDAIEVVSENALAYTTLPYKLKQDRDVVMATVRKDGYILIYMDQKFKEDKEVVMAAIMNFGYAIHYTETLKGDRDVVTAAIIQDSYNFNSASPELQRDPELIKLAINHGYIPTKEQAVIVEREQSSMALHKSDAASAPFHEFNRGVETDLNKRYESHKAKRPYHGHSTVGILNNQGEPISGKLLYEINSFGLGLAPRCWIVDRFLPRILGVVQGENEINEPNAVSVCESA